MASRRQRLSQRRKAVGLTQESLAERLGVERSTVVRWEAGDTEPLPSIRPNLASALQVSLDQLAELLTSTENTDPARATSGGTEVAVPELLAEVAPQAQPDQADVEQLVHPQAAETVEALRQTLRSAEVSPAYVDALLLVCGVSRAPLVTQLLADELGGSGAVRADSRAAIVLSGLVGRAVHPAGLNIASTDVRLDTLVPATAGVAGPAVPVPAQLDGASRPPLATPAPWYRATPRKYQRFAAAGVLVLAGVAASVPFVSSLGAATPPAVTGAAVPAPAGAAIPAPRPGSNHGDIPRSQETVGATPAAPAEPSHPAGGFAPQQAAAAPAPQVTRSTSSNRPASQSASQPKQPAAKTPPPHPRAAQAHAWAQEAALSAREQAARLRSRPPSRP